MQQAAGLSNVVSAASHCLCLQALCGPEMLEAVADKYILWPSLYTTKVSPLGRIGIRNCYRLLNLFSFIGDTFHDISRRAIVSLSLASWYNDVEDKPRTVGRRLADFAALHRT